MLFSKRVYEFFHIEHIVVGVRDGWQPIVQLDGSKCNPWPGSLPHGIYDTRPASKQL
jgi:hypothetical protein